MSNRRQGSSKEKSRTREFDATFQGKQGKGDRGPRGDGQKPPAGDRHRPGRPGGNSPGTYHGKAREDAPQMPAFEQILERQIPAATLRALSAQSHQKIAALIASRSDGTEAKPTLHGEKGMASEATSQKVTAEVPPRISAVKESPEPSLANEKPQKSPGFLQGLFPSKSYAGKSVPLKKKPETHSEPLSASPTFGEGMSSVARSDRGFQGIKKPKPAPEEKITKDQQLVLAKQASLSSLITVSDKPPQALTQDGQKLDPWQAQALAALLRGANVIVDAPTSAGKTRVIEALLEEKMKQGIKLVYTTPVKSLSNDKYREFCELYGRERVGINTGDFKENLGAPIILATLETYRNSLLGVEPNMNRMVVVYDEYHYLQDESRGSAWEESLILTPKHSQVVLLSASVPNTEDFAKWLRDLFQKECEVVTVTHRPVPLVHVVHTKYGWILGDDLNLSANDVMELKRLSQEAKRAKRQRFVKKNFQEFVEPVISALELQMGPIVIYAGRRADVEAIAHAIARSFPAYYSGPDADKMKARINGLPGWEYVPQELQRLVIRYGVAYHHSGMIPPGRVAIETLLKEGLLRACTGTMGISLGVNFSVRGALISDESRPSEGGETRYSNSEILQMLGRAGRRGRDKQGFSLWLNLGRYASQKPAGREPCRSSLKFDPTTVLGILGQHESFAYLSEFYRKSFFMRGKTSGQVALEDHDLIAAALYKKGGFESVPCSDIPSTFERFQAGKNRSQVECTTCPARKLCHPMVADARASVLQIIVKHLQDVKALEGCIPTKLGQIARAFPQAGGLIIAKWISQGEMRGHNFRDYVQAMAMFCSAHFKDIPESFSNIPFLTGLKIPPLIKKFYPEELFPELYDEVTYGQNAGAKVFREFNPGAASIVNMWLNPNTQWDDLVAEHTSKHFSAGDCMMVLFRFSTFMQSCVRIAEYDPEIASQAKAFIRTILREPLDARNRMLAEEVDELEAKVDEPPLHLSKLSVESALTSSGDE